MSHACDFCNKIFNYPSILKMHYRSHIGEKPFQCEFCRKLFSHEAHLIVHKQVHIEKEQYVCEICNDTFFRKSALEEHIELHKEEREEKACVKEGFPNEKDCQNVTLEQDKLHTCVICREVFSKERDLNRHFLSHKDEKPLSSDKKCDETLVKEFVWEICNDTFLQKSALEEHIELHKEEREEKACVKEGFPNEKDCQNVTLEQDKLHTCVICSEVFSKECDLNRHFLAHKDEKPPSSDKKCDETLTKKSQLSARYRVHTKQRSDTAFLKKRNFKTHKRDHTKKKSFECDICHKLFASKGNLNIHYRIHTNEKPFGCNTCGKLFSRKDGLKLHYRVHTKTEPLCVMNAVKNLRGPQT